ncbi:MAG: hypothetical protein JHC33_00680, partial [Ignisphaera sp.]|nr:hypothetical protein [Ignisphaera sp.]
MLDFYKRVLNSMGLPVDEDGYIYTSSADDKMMLTVNGKPLVLPTKEHLNTLLATNESGDIELTKIPYNPLNENVIKGDTESLKRTKLIIEKKLGGALAVAGELLLTLASNTALQKKTTMELNKFLGNINSAQNPGIKKLVDDASLDAWAKIYNNSIITPKGAFSIFLKKSGTYEGVKYNRLATAESVIYTYLLEAVKDVPLYGVKLRNKDITIFRLIFEFLLPDMDSKHTIHIGSNDNESPGFISLFKLFIKIATRTNEIIKSLSFVNESLANEGVLPITVSYDELDLLSKYKNDLLSIPSETDLTRSKVAAKNTGLNVDHGKSYAGSVTNTVYTPPKDTPLPISMKNQPQIEDDPIKRILYGNSVQNTVPNNMMTNVGPGINPQLGSIYGSPYQQPILGGNPIYPLGGNYPSNTGYVSPFGYQSPMNSGVPFDNQFQYTPNSGYT